MALMHRQEIDRARIFGRLAVALAFFVAGLGFAVRGNTTATHVLYVGMAAIAAQGAWLVWRLRTDEGYSTRLWFGVAHTALYCAFSAIYFFGLFSPAPMIMVFGLFFASPGQSARATLSLYLACAAIYGVLGGLLAANVLPDYGVVSSAPLSKLERVVALVAVEGVLFATYFGARITRHASLAAIERHDQVMRRLLARDALLREARAELDRALRAGGMGRFSDTQLGSFRLGRVIGRGGMGEVYDATHIATSSAAAVKLLGTVALTDPDLVRRFMREAKITQSLDSPHVVRVLEVGGLDAPFPYIAMELLRGEDLASLLRRERQMKAGSAVQMVREVARGLEAARLAGIVHRDLKPQNLFWAEEGDRRIWKVLDFGVSKLVGSEGTQTKDAVVGTPSYMAPEQALGGAVTHLTDLHALGVITYRALTGQPAFGRDTLPETLYQVVHGMPPRPSQVAELDQAVDSVLMIALAKRPEDRFDSGEAFADALDAASRGMLSAGLRERARVLELEQPWS